MSTKQDPILFPPMDPEAFAAKLAKYEARGPKSKKSLRGTTYGRMNAAHFDEGERRRVLAAGGKA